MFSRRMHDRSFRHCRTVLAYYDCSGIIEINTEAVAKNKAIQGAQLAGGACVVEDTSLEFHALGGMPGPFIKWFQDKLGCDVSEFNGVFLHNRSESTIYVAVGRVSLRDCTRF